MKIISYNVNGLRAAINKGFTDWLKSVDTDIICLQELKANTEQFDIGIFEKMGFHSYWHSAEKKGYSGVALLSRIKPEKVIIGCGIDKYDMEGRIIRADISDITQVSVYVPSGTNFERQDFKMEFLEFFYDYAKNLLKERKNVIISGDINICHRAIDIHDPIGNAKSSGFLPEEREWVSDFLELGFVDSYRHLNDGKVKYSWWSYRTRARERNLGWRIDYHMVSKSLSKRIRNAEIFNEIVHSDHCPVMLELE